MVAFSLVEVVIAIGVIGFCVIVIVGVMSLAYKSNEKASESTGSALILESTRGALANMPFTNLIATLPNGIWLGFAEEGGLQLRGTSLAQIKANANVFYAVQVSSVGTLPTGTFISSIPALVKVISPPPVFNLTNIYPTAFTRYGPQY